MMATVANLCPWTWWWCWCWCCLLMSMMRPMFMISMTWCCCWWWWCWTCSRRRWWRQCHPLGNSLPAQNVNYEKYIDAIWVQKFVHLYGDSNEWWHWCMIGDSVANDDEDGALERQHRWRSIKSGWQTPPPSCCPPAVVLDFSLLLYLTSMCCCTWLLSVLSCTWLVCCCCTLLLCAAVLWCAIFYQVYNIHCISVHFVCHIVCIMESNVKSGRVDLSRILFAPVFLFLLQISRMLCLQIIERLHREI